MNVNRFQVTEYHRGYWSCKQGFVVLFKFVNLATWEIKTDFVF